MDGIKKLRDELLACETVRPSLETARKVAFDMVSFCINNSNDLLDKERRPYADAAPFIREFWNQYWGEMILVEGRDVAAAMVNYGNVLNDLRDDATKHGGTARPGNPAPAPPQRKLPETLLERLRDAHKQLTDALAAERAKPLEVVLQH
jgi:hypothetical protein